ncbi:FAD:protein FMN transferase [Methanococcoides methylutens]|uniref:FAD:protein FMN transferase n=1 Tax=Methanococcoides methylutens MM1 TaxID=1434104 RepID=A0A0E3SS45_METMT|nr:FAD:protein FMN transferase [Methanococcoides methylutens]AKB85931.1 Thiamin biosynthesis lipoprotein ApbE [Methanococcoides methylutens MM1]
MDKKTVLLLVLIVIVTVSFSALYEEQESSFPTQNEIFNTDVRSIMDTTVTISIYDSDGEHAGQSIDKAFERIGNVDGIMSTYKNESQASALNEQSKIEGASPDLIYVVERSLYYSEISNGAFDITIMPILDLWASKFSPGGTYQPPTQEEIDITLELVDYRMITIEGDNIYMEPGMKIALGGIAKGYAVDQAIEVLLSEGITSCFVDAGGDGRYIGTKPDGSQWTVGLQNPDKQGDFITVMQLEDMAVATSGNYERYFSDAAKVSHISDPRTGYSVNELISATVIAGNTMDADALATTVFVLGEEEGMQLIESLEGVECLIITSDKRIIRSEGFAEYETTIEQ